MKIICYTDGTNDLKRHVSLTANSTNLWETSQSVIKLLRAYCMISQYIICVVVLVLVTRLVVIVSCAINKQVVQSQVRTSNQQTVFAIKDTELVFSVSQSICTMFITTVHTRNKLQSVDWTVYCGLEHQFVDWIKLFL